MDAEARRLERHLIQTGGLREFLVRGLATLSADERRKVVNEANFMLREKVAAMDGELFDDPQSMSDQQIYDLCVMMKKQFRSLPKDRNLRDENWLKNRPSRNALRYAVLREAAERGIKCGDDIQLHPGEAFIQGRSDQAGLIAATKAASGAAEVNVVGYDNVLQRWHLAADGVRWNAMPDGDGGWECWTW